MLSGRNLPGFLPKKVPLVGYLHKILPLPNQVHLPAAAAPPEKLTVQLLL